MIKSIISNLFISILLVVPLLLKTTGLASEFNDMLVSGLSPLLIFLIIFNFVGLLCLQTVAKFANFIDTQDIIEHSKEQEKLETNIIFKIYRLVILTLLFGLLLYNRMFLTTIFACIWWLSRHLFKTQFDKFVKGLE